LKCNSQSAIRNLQFAICNVQLAILSTGAVAYMLILS